MLDIADKESKTVITTIFNVLKGKIEMLKIILKEPKIKLRNENLIN